MMSSPPPPEIIVARWAADRSAAATIAAVGNATSKVVTVTALQCVSNV
jgi:hypothetical protein